MLGPYGNTWFDTPALNQLAAESILFEQCIADTPDPVRGFQSLIMGRHFCQQTATNISLMDLVDDSVHSILVTTQPAGLPEVYDQFDQVVEVGLPMKERLADDIGATQLATFFAAAIEEINKFQPGTMLFLHCDTLAECWDAPYAIRLSLADEDDPEPSSIAQAKNQQFNVGNDDPDQLLDCQIAYGAQIVVLDELLNVFLDQLSQCPTTRNCLFAMTSLRGYPLGEHGVVGFYRNQLHNESLHVPMLVRYPDSKFPGRSQRLVQPGSLFQFLGNWHGRNHESCFPHLQTQELQPDATQHAVISGLRCDSLVHHCIQTHGWKLIVGNSKQLFVRPDDIWEYNDVANLCAEIVLDLEEQLVHVRGQLEAGIRPQLTLPDELAYGIE